MTLSFSVWNWNKINRIYLIYLNAALRGWYKNQGAGNLGIYIDAN